MQKGILVTLLTCLGWKINEYESMYIFPHGNTVNFPHSIGNAIRTPLQTLKVINIKQ